MRYPKVSVVIATYNRSNKVGDAISSIEKSSYPKNKIEILMVDDCSTDSTRKVIENLAKRYKNVRYYQTKNNSGPAAARNIGIRHAKGEYLFFTDDDCIVSKSALMQYVTFLEKNKKVAGVGGALIPSSNNLIARIEMLKDRILKIDDKRLRIGRDVPVGFTCNMIYRKRVLNEVGYFNEKFRAPAGEDVELKERVAKKYDLAVMPVVVKHNHDYNFDYLLSIIFKQGLGKNPPRGRFNKICLLIVYSPILLINLIKKTLRYRRGCK